ncbi:hypothetical protein ACFX1S_020507 [Malus domestica]
MASDTAARSTSAADPYLEMYDFETEGKENELTSTILFDLVVMCSNDIDLNPKYGVAILRGEREKRLVQRCGAEEARRRGMVVVCCG